MAPVRPRQEINPPPPGEKVKNPTRVRASGPAGFSGAAVTPVLLYFLPVPAPHRFAWRFNDLSCISPPRRPVNRLFFFLQTFSSQAPPERNNPPGFPTAPIVFSLFFIVPAPTAFLKLAQRLAL
jgi:hypothetical protein